LQPQVNPDRLGIYGTSYGGATVVWVGAVDSRVKCVVSVVGIGNGRRWLRSVRRPDEWYDLLDRAKTDREKRVLDGQSAIADRSQILLPDRQSAELAAAARRANPAAVNELPLEFIDDTLGFHPEWSSIKSHLVRSCLLRPTMTGWCPLKSRRRCSPKLGNLRNWSSCAGLGTTRSMPSQRSAK